MPNSRPTARARTNAGTKGVPRADRELQIVRTAAEVFGSDGFARASVAAVAERAGISKPLVYQYFGSKEGLFSAVIHHGGTQLAEEMERIAQGDSVGLERGLRTLDGLFRFLEPQPWLWRIFFDPTAPSDGDVADALGQYMERITQLALEGVGELMSLLGDNDPLDVSAMTSVWMSISDTLVNWWVDHPDVTPGDMTARCYRLFAAVAGADLPPLDLVDIEGISRL